MMNANYYDFKNIEVNKNNCFTLLKYIFAFYIVFHHFLVITSHVDYINPGIFVNGFFIISGFLIFNSYIHNNDLKLYAQKRIKRIYPPYFITILFCVILGLTITSLDCKSFIFSPITWKYITSNLLFLNFVQPNLPGVFENNELPYIDASLWTLKVEILFYVTVPIVYYLFRYIKVNTIILGISLFSIIYYIITNILFYVTNNTIFYSLSHQIFGMLSYFYIPVFILFNQQKFKSNHIQLLIISVIIFILSYTIFPVFTYLEPITLSIIVLSIALYLKKLSFSYKWKDISYEIFLLHFPIIQTLATLNYFKDNIYIMFIASIIVILLCSFLLHYICKLVIK
jgi:peptidoglycan/LPS O-acetylase OafA/YrhL